MMQLLVVPFAAPRQKPEKARHGAGQPPHAGWLRRLWRDRRGVTALEFAIIGPVFLLLIFGIFENALTLWTQAVLDNATRDAARLTLTGQTQNGGTSFPAALCSKISGLMSCANLSYRIQTASSFGSLSPTITTNSNGTLKNFQTYPSVPSSGSAGDYVLVQVVYNRPYILPWVGALMSTNGKAEILATAAFQNEPY